MSRAQPHAEFTDTHATIHNCDCHSCALAERNRLREALGHANAQAERFEREWYLRGDEIERLRADANRMDWLADPGNSIGCVQLPARCVTANLHSLRAAIDMAMRIDQTGD
jgi:hypothetical protein